MLLYRGARAIGLRGRLLCRRPDEPDLDNASVGRTPSRRIDAAGNASGGFFLVTSSEGVLRWLDQRPRPMGRKVAKRKAMALTLLGWAHGRCTCRGARQRC